MADMEMVVGLEVHCQLKTATKLFCACPASSFQATPNANICPVCTGQPGALPVLNRRAVELAFTAALALECRLRETSLFARKSYFYPDLPKGYQISQYEEPFSIAGRLDLPGPPAKRVGIHRVHLEEDAGKLVHDIGSEELDCSLADYNRSGVPLIEIVSEPDLRGPGEAYQYLTALKDILRYIEVSDCDMEKGEMRCDANVSVRPRGGSGLGDKVEVKNLNSFRNVKDALEYEFKRQAAILESGGRIPQETRLWDADRAATAPMRSKEEAHDYRYFPEPDLVALRADPALVGRLSGSLPELPAARRARLAAEYNLSEYDAGVLTGERILADYYEACVAAAGKPSAKTAANLIATELLGKLNAEKLELHRCPVPARRLGELVGLLDQGTVSSKLAKEVLTRMWETGKPAGELVETLGLSLVSDEERLADWVAAAMASNPKAVADLKAGKERAVGAIVGAVMKASRSKADPAAVQRLIRKRLQSS